MYLGQGVVAVGVAAETVLVGIEDVVGPGIAVVVEHRGADAVGMQQATDHLTEAAA